MLRHFVKKYSEIRNVKLISNCIRNAKFSTEALTENIKNYLDVKVENIRNFSIIAHVDHGKSTLSDRLLEITGALKKGSGKSQVLDTLAVEQERGITVKANCVSLLYRLNGELYLLTLYDTPGHTDFSNEVARSLKIASSGAILLIDANQGVQAQTLATYHMAMSKNLKIVPVINKIDLKNANPEKVTEDLLMMLNIDPDEVLKISAKLGTGIESVLEHVITKIPAPVSDRDAPFRGHLIDSSYDRYRGALNLMFIKDGEIRLDQEIQSHQTGRTYVVRSLSILTPEERKVNCLSAGQIGLVGCNMRNTKEAIIGDTYFVKNVPVEPLEEFERLKPMVFAGIYPQDQSQHLALRSAIEKLMLNDSSVTVTNDTSPALGHGFRVGFLGLLHMEVFSQRLENEHDSMPIITAPNVTYKIKIKEIKGILQRYNGKSWLEVSNPKYFPDNPADVEEFYEPTVLATIITPQSCLGQIIGLCVEKRGIQQSSINLDSDRILLKYILPLNEVIIDFHDHIKSLSSGFASFDYEESEYISTSLVKLDIMLNGVTVDELSIICHSRNVENRARELTAKLKELIPRQMVEIRIQACVGTKVIARETQKAYRKDVTQWLYGGDVTRRKKLLKQQAEGKKKMRLIANINVPRDTFIKVLKR